MKRLPAYLGIIVLLMMVMSGCTSQRQAMAPAVEDDDLYYFPGSVYVDEYASSDEQVNDDTYVEEDYYDPNANNGFTPGFSPNGNFNNGFNNGFNPGCRPGSRFRMGVGMNMGMGMFRPMGGMGMNSFNMGFGMPMGGFGMNPMMPSNYFYGYSAFGSPMFDPWYGGMGMGGFYDPFYDPWFNNSMCFGGGWGNPWGFNNMWGSPFGNYWGNPMMGGWGNNFGWNPWMGDLWGQGNQSVYGQRRPFSTGSNYNSGYTGGSVYESTTPRLKQPSLENEDSGFGSRPMQSGSRGDVLDTPTINDRQNPASRGNDYDYFDSGRTRETTSPVNPAGRQPNTSPANNSRQNNPFQNFFNGGSNSRGGSSPSTTPRGGSRPNYSPAGGSRPASGGSRGSFGGGGSRSGGSSAPRSTGSSPRRR